MGKIFDEIIESLENDDLNAENLKFGKSYQVIAKLGKGEQGIVLKVKNKIDKNYALKFYSPISTEITDKKLKSGIQSFKKEIDITKELNHKNIVKIITGGFAKWENNIWIIEEGFNEDNLEKLKSGYVLFYIMDFIDGCGLEEIFTQLSLNEINKVENSEKLSKEEKEKKIIKLKEAYDNAVKFSEIYKIDKIKVYENLISQVTRAISFFNNSDVFHTDIKPDNIRYSHGDQNFVIVDFGFARDLYHENIPLKTDEEDELEKSNWGHFKEYDDTESNKRKGAEKYSKVDMYQFSALLSDILPEFVGSYHPDRIKGMIDCFNKAKGVWEKRYKNLNEFYSSVMLNFVRKSNWRLYISNGEYLTPSGFGRFNDSPILIPPNRLVYITKEIQQIIDCSEFQRLKDIRQLGPTREVFPGANHTRFEHSLGVYWLSLRYLERLLKNHDFRMACEPIEQTIKLTVLAALLHDIGHYPYSHWIEEIKYENNGNRPIKSIEKHEVRACKFLDKGEIGKVIKTVWQKDDEDLITPLKKILANQVHDSKDVSLKIINSIINSQVDADKLDYLIRDSIHTGTYYGLSIDIERFIMSLCLSEKKDHIALTTKGKQVFNSFITARNNMYEGVYWHKTVRCAESMFKMAFYIYLEKTNEKKEEIESLFDSSDDYFVKTLYNWLKTNSNENSDLMAPFVYSNGSRNLYKPVFIYYQNDISENEYAGNFFDTLLNKKFSDLIPTRDSLISVLNKNFPEFNNELNGTDLLIETTPLRPYNREVRLEKEFTFYNERKKRYEGVSDFFNQQLGYLDKNKQCYLFCHPKYEKIFNKILDEEVSRELFYKSLSEVKS